MQLRISDPVYTERLVAFFESVGQNGSRADADLVELDREIPDPELRIYLQVWSVLYPDAAVSIE